jgi:protease stability complex PrcB-like protein
MRMIAGFLAAAALLASIGAPGHAVKLGVSGQSGWTRAQTTEARDSASLRRGWQQLFPAISSRPALPGIDFTTTRVIFIAAGSRPTGGYRFDLVGSTIRRDSAIVTLTLFTPPAGCGVTQELTAPAMAIALPTLPGPYRIITRERRDTVRCN